MDKGERYRKKSLNSKIKAQTLTYKWKYGFFKVRFVSQSSVLFIRYFKYKKYDAKWLSIIAAWNNLWIISVICENCHLLQINNNTE